MTAPTEWLFASADPISARAVRVRGIGREERCLASGLITKPHGVAPDIIHAHQDKLTEAEI
jgi:hypothetical protein